MSETVGAGAVSIRAIEERDLPRWRELFRAYGVFYETDFDDAVLDSTGARLLAEGSGVDGLVAELDGEVVGFAHYRRHPDTFSTGHDWYLDDLYTDEAARGRGVASALIDALAHRATATGPGTLRWITAADNARAQRVYDRLATRTSWVTYEKRF
ncbi:MAG: GNAT family N-acetyltransferase [Actinomycetales bacterium]|nr:GNAT family N-acetyltransferase [Actinomycetales bacterium]